MRPRPYTPPLPARDEIHAAAEGVALDADMLAELRLQHGVDPSKGIQTNELEIRAPDGDGCLIEYAHDLMRIALIERNFPLARDIALRVHREIVDELAARPELLGAEVVR